MTSSLLAACRRTFQAFRAFTAARDGNVAIMFAMSLIPLVGLVGAAVDYSRANSAKVAMQAALDSATLMLSKEANGLNQDQLQQKAIACSDIDVDFPPGEQVVGGPVVRVRLDDPAWPQPVWGVLIESTDDGLVRLIWRRDRKDDG